MIPEKPGIFKSNGVYASTLNLAKKAKRRKDFELVEVCQVFELEDKLRQYQGLPPLDEDEDNSVMIYKYYNPEKHEYIDTTIEDRPDLIAKGYTRID